MVAVDVQPSWIEVSEEMSDTTLHGLVKTLELALDNDRRSSFHYAAETPARTRYLAT